VSGALSTALEKPKERLIHTPGRTHNRIRSPSRLQVVASGTPMQQQTQQLHVGQQVQVTGFLNRHEGRNGLSQLVLHAQHIERIF